MRPSRPSIAFACALMLAACGSQTPSEAPPRETATPEAAPVAGPERHILAFGDSLFAGYNVPNGDSYPDKLQAALRTKGVNASVSNAGVSGDTTAAGLQRLAFTLDAQATKPDLVILELGGNDLLRGLSPDQTKANLAKMLEVLKARRIPVLLMGMRAPPNYGPQYQKAYDAAYPALAKQYDAALVPFFLEPVYDKPKLIQSDHIHPTSDGIDVLVGATVDQVEKALPKAD